MRIHLKISSTDEIIPFNHQEKMVGTINKWIGTNNAEHGAVSLFSFSRLEGGKALIGKGLKYENGASFFISAHNDEIIKSIVWGIQQDNTLFGGMSVAEMALEQNPDLSNRERFYVASPIFIKRSTETHTEHIVYTDERASQYLKETLQTKMKMVGIIDDDFEIYFNTTDRGAGTKLINYKGIGNRANWCSVSIKGSAETKLFAWNVGLGNSTGIGFGAIR